MIEVCPVGATKYATGFMETDPNRTLEVTR